MSVLRFLRNTIEICDQFDTRYEKEFDRDFAVGSTITVKYPQRFTIRDGLEYNPQGINRISTTVSLNQIFGIDFQWDDYEKMVYLERSVEELKENYLMPAGRQLANEADTRAALWATQNTNNVFGVLGTDPTTVNPYVNADQLLFAKSCPPEADRSMIVSSSMQGTILPYLMTLLQPSKEIADQYRKNRMGSAFGWEWSRSNNLQRFTAGTIAGTLLVEGAGQSGSSLIVQGTVNDTINKGDAFQIANVNFVNPMSRAIPSAPTLQWFVATNNFVLTGGHDTITISPAIFGPGSQYQNVDALPVDQAALTMWTGTTSPSGKSGMQGLGLAKNVSFAMVGGTFEKPKAVELCTSTKDPDTGLSVRFVRSWDAVHSLLINRFDCCLGFGNLYPDNGGVRLVGA